MRAFYQPAVAYFRKINWTLLLFLILFLNVKMMVKIVAVGCLLLLNYKLFQDKTIFRQKFILFYVCMIGIALLNLLLIPVTTNYIIAVSAGIIFWMLCTAAALLNSWFVLKTDTSKLHSTVSLFFLTNAAVTLVQLVLIMLDAGSFNPYTYQGMYQKYFIGTGDLLTGASFDVSTTNALLNAFGVVYFLSRNKMILALLCMIVLLFTASNFTNVLIAGVLLFLFIFQSTKEQKSIILVCVSLLVIFMIRVSPQNNNYVTETTKKLLNKDTKIPAVKKFDTLVVYKPDSILTGEEKKQKIAMLFLDSIKRIRMELVPLTMVTKPVMPKPNIHSEPFQRKKDTTLLQKELLAFAIQKIPDFNTDLEQTGTKDLPGKLLAIQQTFHFFKTHPSKIVTGTGTGNFSSKLAFRTTGLPVAGGYPDEWIYINDAFLSNHLNLYLSYFSKDVRLHSLTNSPNSVYDQLVAEYGLTGLAAFIFLYAGFFFKKIKKMTYGLPLLLLLLGAFGVEYWYEQLSIVIVFELLMLLNIKETGE
ncbi:hypothetical protein [Terrimonas alba]|uniref:hypothetical protein n=1 Tax=Terrimonas alba TaxID=3349636 RepID=UPI0035F4BF86